MRCCLQWPIIVGTRGYCEDEVADYKAAVKAWNEMPRYVWRQGQSNDGRHDSLPLLLGFICLYVDGGHRGSIAGSGGSVLIANFIRTARVHPDGLAAAMTLGAIYFAALKYGGLLDMETILWIIGAAFGLAVLVVIIYLVAVWFDSRRFD